jgi:hypothetical protein
MAQPGKARLPQRNERAAMELVTTTRVSAGEAD